MVESVYPYVSIIVSSINSQ